MPLRPHVAVRRTDGRWGCGRHGKRVCGVCCVDYAYLNSDTDDSTDDDGDDIDDIDDNIESEGLENQAREQDDDSRPAQSRPWQFLTIPHDSIRELSAGAMPPREMMPVKFIKPQSSPSDPRFHIIPAPLPHGMRPFIYRNDPNKALIYTDGACLDNGRDDPRAGWAFVFAEKTANDEGGLALRLENTGPSGERQPQTSNRAELRAVLAALQFRYWKALKFDQLIIATDSEYVVKGATERVHAWSRRGWTTAQGEPVRNQDLWKAIFATLADLAKDTVNCYGIRVAFWRIPREYNTAADALARSATAEPDIPCYCEFAGI